MKNIALVTCEMFPRLIEEEKYIVDLFPEHGIQAEPVIWDDPSADWTRFDLIIIRNTWDYFNKFEEFQIWLNYLESINAPVMNPIHIIKENMHKLYMKTLEEQGILIVPTYFADKNTSLSIKSIIKDNEWEKFIIKPAVSGGAKDTYLFSREEALNAQETFDRLIGKKDMLIQKYMNSIESGEWSMMFFNNVYSHSVFKAPAPKDFRVQENHGGSIKAEEAPAYIIEQAKALIRKQGENLLYARVDGVEEDGKFYLMELELIEPQLFLKNNIKAQKMFVEAVVKRISD
jgi:glutathione synthase/RimK-type ligase-like ATP-grasp enzyme